MYGLWASGNISSVLVNMAVIALWPVLPLLIIVYMRQSLIARCTRLDFALRKSEMVELDRAVLLYEKVCSRINEIGDREGPPVRLWRALLARPTNVSQQNIDELEELEAHAQHLRATMVRLTNRPLQRLRSWVHIRSSLAGSGFALATHVVTLTLFILASYAFQKSMWINEFATGANRLVWYRLDERIFYANAIAIGFASVAAPLFYLIRRTVLRREYSFEFSIFKDLANAGPARAGSSSQQEDTNCRVEEGSWVTILGLSESATMREVKEAYKVLIKQNHPDRVHGMSPAFKTLAEAETKKLNAAYRQALRRTGL
jgi:DnaJ domain